MRRIALLFLVIGLGGCQLMTPQTVMDASSMDEAIQILERAAQAPEITVETMVVADEVVEPVIEGPRFDLSVENADAAGFFRSLVADTPFNMVVHPQVSGTVTLDLQAVTVPDVMGVMRDMHNFDYTLNGNVYQVFANELRTEIFDLNYLNVARSGQSEIQVSAGKVSQNNQNNNSNNNGGSNVNGGNSGSQQVVGTIVNTQADSDLWQEVRATLRTLVAGDEDSEVVVTPQVGLVVVKARPKSLRSVKDYLSQVENSVSRQVILEAKIIEVTLKDGFQAGINWNTFGDASGGVFRPTEELQDDGTTVLVGGSEHAVAGSFGGTGAADFMNPLNASFALQAALGDFDATVNLLRTQGTVQVLSSPRIATVNNQKAVIKVGSDEFFVTDISSNTVTAGSAINTNDSPELTPFFSGIALDVTPQISAADDVILHVHPTVSEVTEQLKEIGGEVVPLAASSIRESDSIVRARSGEIIVIGGLMQNSAKDNNARVPWLSKIPWLGRFFKYKSQESVKSELVILLKPVVVKPGVQQRYVQRSARHAQQLRENVGR